MEIGVEFKMGELLAAMEMYLGAKGGAAVIIMRCARMMGVHLNTLGLERTRGRLIEEFNYGVNEIVGVPM